MTFSTIAEYIGYGVLLGAGLFTLGLLWGIVVNRLWRSLKETQGLARVRYSMRRYHADWNRKKAIDTLRSPKDAALNLIEEDEDTDTLSLATWCDSNNLLNVASELRRLYYTTVELEDLLAGTPHVHIKTGGTYVLLGQATVQTDKPLTDLSSVALYRGENGRLWVRPESEFAERFSKAPT